MRLIYNTRFNPTANGPLHVGHLYLILVNEFEAHRTGGKFIVRIEDDQAEWVWRLRKAKIEEYCDLMRGDLEWMGIKVDEWQLQSELMPIIEDSGRHLWGGEFEAEKRMMFDNLEVPLDDTVFYPYAPYLSFYRVLMDIHSMVNLLIRGIDLISEHCLYAYFCDKFGFFKPRMVYLPRLKLQDRRQMYPGLSKTGGTHKLQAYRERGYCPDEIIALLRESCLIDPKGNWEIYNIKREPLWIG